MNDNNLKKSTKKWIYIGTGLAFFILIAVGVGFWFWNKSKNSNKSDSTENINPEELPAEIKNYRKKNWRNEITGLSDYKIPSLPGNVSIPRAKDELLEAYWQWIGKPKSWDKKKIGKVLERNAKQINLDDNKENEKDALFGAKFSENLDKKYQQNIFSSLPKQEKFWEEIDEADFNLHFLRISFSLKYKGNKKIDWIASLREEQKKIWWGTKTQQEEDFVKLTNHLEREINPFIGRHINQFPALSNLKELNQWSNILVRKLSAGSWIAHRRFYLGSRIGKEVLSPVKGAIKEVTFDRLKNENFNLKPVVNIFKV